MRSPAHSCSTGVSAARYAIWLVLVCLVGLVYLSYNWLSETPTELERVKLNDARPPDRTAGLKQATMAPGRVVELHTNKGRIDFVLFEKDCPRTSAHVAAFVSAGCYNGLRFTRVEKDGLIQVEECKRKVPPIRLEVVKGLTNTKGAVGLARSEDSHSAASSFYILIEPWHHLDYEYCVFGRLIRGMDVVTRIRKNDVIRSARLRPFTVEDRKLFYKVLQTEAERKVN